jgi:uncharacterized protein
VDVGLGRDALTAALGAATGVLSGAFGVGGAIVSQPGIRALGVAPLVAVGTTLPSIVPSAVSGALRYRREGMIDRRAVALTVPVGLATAVVGALLSDVVPGDGHLLMVATAGLLALTAVRIGRSALEPATTPAPATPAGRRHRGAFIITGAAAGLLSGLLGIGGGVVMVPGFTQLAGMALKRAIATSLVCVGLFAVPGTVTHALQDQIDWRVALILTVTVIPGSRLGAALTVRADERPLRAAVGVFLLAVAAVYATSELIALFG